MKIIGELDLDRLTENNEIAIESPLSYIVAAQGTFNQPIQEIMPGFTYPQWYKAPAWRVGDTYIGSVLQIVPLVELYFNIIQKEDEAFYGSLIIQSFFQDEVQKVFDATRGYVGIEKDDPENEFIQELQAMTSRINKENELLFDQLQYATEEHASKTLLINYFKSTQPSSKLRAEEFANHVFEMSVFYS